MTFKAEQWSEHSLNIGILTNKPNNEFGENLWHRENTSLNDLMMSDEMNPVKFWYDQIKFYSGYYISHPDEYSGKIFNYLKIEENLTYQNLKIFFIIFES